MCDGYICNPCAIGASLELIDSNSLDDYVQYKPPKSVASIDIITVDATQRDVLRYAASQGAQEILEMDSSDLHLYTELCQEMNVSYHGYIKGNVKGPTYKVMISANDFMYQIDWHTSFPRGEDYHAWTLMHCISMTAIHAPLLTTREYVFQIGIADLLLLYTNYTKVQAISVGEHWAKHVEGHPCNACIDALENCIERRASNVRKHD